MYVVNKFYMLVYYLCITKIWWHVRNCHTPHENPIRKILGVG